MAAPGTQDTLNTNNIQGDILSGLPKKAQAYLFFQIVDVQNFRKQLTRFAPLVTTVAQVLKDRQAIGDHKKLNRPDFFELTGVNIAFSHQGFLTLGINDSTLTQERDEDGHNPFELGQLASAKDLGDKGTDTSSGFVPTNWEAPFLQHIHAIILVSGDSDISVEKKLAEIRLIFGLPPILPPIGPPIGHPTGPPIGHPTPHPTPPVALPPILPTIRELITIRGHVRPGDQKGHEHFGFMDGISNPSVIGFDLPIPGPRPVRSGIFLTGHPGDPVQVREPWAVDGSFLAFRYLFQKVPEFNQFLLNNAAEITANGVTPTQVDKARLLGARLIGRWPSGAPIDLAPFHDDPQLAADPNRNNDFRYAAETNIQKICPFAAHTRKTNPRADLEDHEDQTGKLISIEHNRIMRRGVQFGPEVQLDEQLAHTTIHGRGLLFASYQTSLLTGFEFIQKSWVNNPIFPPFRSQGIEAPGLDPIIGQGTAVRQLSGTDPDDPQRELGLTDFVVPHGGEYFFSPSLKGLKERIALPA